MQSLEGAYALTEHLLSLGHRRIGYVSAPVIYFQGQPIRFVCKTATCYTEWNDAGTVGYVAVRAADIRATRGEIGQELMVRRKGAAQLGFNFEDEIADTIRGLPEDNTTSTFADNLAAPIHRWFRYSAGFSAPWCRELIEREVKRGRRRLLDPFVGSGTALLEAESCGIEALGIEAHPFVARVARAKLSWREDPKAFRTYATMLLDRAKRETADLSNYPPLIIRCYPPEVLARLDTLRRAWQATADGSPCSELAWLCLSSILRATSPVGTAQWQYILPNKAKARPVDPYQAFEARLWQMSQDMSLRQERVHGPRATVYREDARTCSSVLDAWADLVITSPPYANNYDYADATRLEMSFFGEVQGWRDLQHTVRQHLIRSCTQHVAKLARETVALVDDPLLSPIRDELRAICVRLESERDGHGGKKPYHAMVAAYFHDLAQVWHALRRVTQPGRTLICFVVGDSAPYGIYVPVDDWLGKLALAAGFHQYSFEKARDRNVKWKNRKHTVPLHEGRLWVEG